MDFWLSARGRRAGFRALDGSVDNVATCSYITVVTTVGIREMKNRLSDYVRRVRRGETILVTDRGRVVARLTPPAADDGGDDEVIDRLEAEGLLSSRGSENRPELYGDLAPSLPEGAVVELLDAVRGDR